MLCYAMLCCAMLCYAMLYAILLYAMLCYAALCYAVLFSGALSYTMLYMEIGEAATFSNWLYTASSSSANNSLYTARVDYYTYIESTRVVRKPRATRCLRENATVLVRLRAR